MTSIHHTSHRDDWNTPAPVLDRVRLVAPIGLDPCSNLSSIVNARVELRLPQRDGLSCSWVGELAPGEVAFANPVYGRHIGPWMAKCAEEARRGADIIALVAARPDTAWFRVCWDTAAAICFWRGRITFLGAPYPAPFPSAVVLWSDSVKVRTAFSGAFWTAGKVVTL